MARAVRFGNRIGAVVIAAIGPGCSTLWESGAAMMTPAAPVEARLAPVGGSAVGGSVVFAQRETGVVMLVHLTGLAPGAYRVVVHESGVCTSPNGFSAGAPWSPPGQTSPLADRMSIINANPESGTATLTERLPGARIDGSGGLQGRSVVVHAGTGSLAAEPDVPNRRVACGVIGPRRSTFFGSQEPS